MNIRKLIFYFKAIESFNNRQSIAGTQSPCYQTCAKKECKWWEGECCTIRNLFFTNACGKLFSNKKTFCN